MLRLLGCALFGELIYKEVSYVSTSTLVI